MINFDEEINRLGTNSSKYDNMERIYGVSPMDGLPMWTADMDFRAPDCVLKCLQELTEHGIFGYYGNQISYNKAVKSWYENRHNWEIEERWISVVHGLVAGIGLSLKAFSNEGDGVIVFTPVYHSFLKMVVKNNRTLVENPLSIQDGRYIIDFDRLERKMTGSEKIVLFCSPHNPGGRVWEINELKKLADFCEQYNLILISDEIHNDLVYEKSKHLMVSVAAPQVRNRLVVLTSSSKTFNLAGGLMGNVIIENSYLRSKFKKVHESIGTTPNLFGMKIAERAYREGAIWLDELLPYLENNTKIFDAGINNLNGLEAMKLSATYLSWVNFKALELSDNELIDLVHKKAGIVASVGSSFGTGGRGYMRFNLACPKAKIYEACERLSLALSTG